MAKKGSRPSDLEARVAALDAAPVMPGQVIGW